MSTATLTAAEITDARLDVIAHAREVLVRARSEHGAWRDSVSLFRVTAAMASLEGALRDWESGGGDKAVRKCARWSSRVVAAFESVMGPEAAAYVNCGEGEWAA